MSDPPDDPQLAADIAELRALTAGLRPLLASLRGRVLTADELASLRKLAATMVEMRTFFAFYLEDDDGAALRRVLGDSPQGRA